ncbi:MAG: hypothetical protein KDD11_02155 [Acidobacteria bacterium]|nr:hypothetical protein [Acidobacteriota bacterium]
MVAHRLLQLMLTAWVSLALLAAPVELPEQPEIACCCGDQCFMACARGAHHPEPPPANGGLRPASACSDSCPTQHLGQKVPGPQPSLAPATSLEAPDAGDGVPQTVRAAASDIVPLAALARGPPLPLPSPS